MNGLVYVVHCVDTEGPLYESPEATVARINSIFGLNLPENEQTLSKLHDQQLQIDESYSKINKILNQVKSGTNEDWSEIENQFNNISSDNFRNQYPDSNGNPWVYNWFIVDHVGFTGRNPRRRSLGHHAIFDKYREWIAGSSSQKDGVYWHYHPPAVIPDAHRSGTAYLNSSNIWEILARKIIDRAWFPSAFRPGFHTERPDSHWFLEQWIPFDFGNQRYEGVTDQPDLGNGRFGHWDEAPRKWNPYNPAHDNYQAEGQCNRYITRCLNMDTRHRNLQPQHVREAFDEAQICGHAILSFVNHDFRDMASHVKKVHTMISDVALEYDDVAFMHTNAVNAMLQSLSKQPPTSPGLNSNMVKTNGKVRLELEAESDIFGTQPFFAFKLKNGDYHWQNLDFHENKWYYTFDFNTVELSMISKIGVAANSPTGVAEILQIDPDGDEIRTQIYPPDK